jgi:superfamily II DNA/RNA helicase
MIGQGLDVRSIKIVVQYRVPDSLSTLAQRLGRGGRDHTLEAVGILLAEAEHFDEVKEATKQHGEARALKRKGKRQKERAQTKHCRVDMTVQPAHEYTPANGPHSGHLLPAAPQLQCDSASPHSSGSDASVGGRGLESGGEDVSGGGVGGAISPGGQGSRTSQTRTGQRSKGVKAKYARAPRVIEVEMIDSINAENRPLRCRRKILNAYFGNDKLGGSLVN